MSSHLRVAHAQACGKSKLSVLLEVSEGPADETKTQSCPFCGEKHLLKRLMEHIAGHLEELSLFVLPNDESSDPAEEISSEALSSLDSAKDDISDVGKESERKSSPDIDLLVWDTTESASMDPASTIGSPVKAAPSGPSVYRCNECDRIFDQHHKLMYETSYRRPALGIR